MAPVQYDYIPLGCLTTPTHSHSEEDLRQLADSPQESSATPATAPVLPAGPRSPDWHVLHPDTYQKTHPDQAIFLKSSSIQNLHRLFENRWIKLEYTIPPHHPSQTIWRVYMLPDDVGRGRIDRNEKVLLTARRHLLQALDYSQAVWSGNPSLPPQRFPELVQPIQDDEAGSLSLLELFNSIEAPNPSLDDVRDGTLRFITSNLLEGDIEGLTSELYPYQRRSVATMAIREAEPGRFFDPRLHRVKDQNGKEWFFDPEAHVVLQQPRYYDGVRGGILAEQMGAGKTLMCLALILATRPLPTPPPPYRTIVRRRRAKTPSLADIAAACATANGLPCAWYFETVAAEGSLPSGCLKALQRNPGKYEVPFKPKPTARPSRRISTLVNLPEPPPKAVLLSQTSFVAVPPNLIQQWQQEISKHTTSLKVLHVTAKMAVPEPAVLAQYDILLCSHSALEAMVRRSPADGEPLENNYLSGIHFKRVIVDEGHRLGNSRINTRSDFHRGLDSLHATARWIVTGTPSKGLYGVDSDGPELSDASKPNAPDDLASKIQEKQDIEKIGAIAKLYLKARPWANSVEEGEKPADWKTYVLSNNHRGHGRHSTLRGALNSLIVRHPLAQLTHMYPAIDEKTTVLEGSYQDKLALNVFSMVIIFNAVQSQRTDVDYLFHPRQRKALMELLTNLKQACFFGGVFFSPNNLSQAVKTAEKFLEDKAVPISDEDHALIRSAIDVAEVALANLVRNLSNEYHEVPILVQDFLPEAAGAWCFEIGDGKLGGCTNASLVVAAQKLIRSSLHDEAEFNTLLNGGLIEKGAAEKEKIALKTTTEPTVAGKNSLGEDKHPDTRKKAQNIDIEGESRETGVDEAKLPDTFKKAQLVATASAKISYLLDSIAEHHENEHILVFYENDNVAFYIASMLDVIHVNYLIYGKSLTAERKATYVDTFNSNDRFRVMLMDIGQAAYGLDMRAASRIYFMTPVLNPQIQAQAIGRARRISQQKPVTVETLVLKDSIEEVIVQRKSMMTQAEHWKVKSILDDRPIHDWILGARIRFDTHTINPLEQFVPLKNPQPIFATGFGREVHPDEGLVGHARTDGVRQQGRSNGTTNGVQRKLLDAEDEKVVQSAAEPPKAEPTNGTSVKRKLEANGLDVKLDDMEGPDRAARRVRFG